jgi:hypothetical protein
MMIFVYGVQGSTFRPFEVIAKRKFRRKSAANVMNFSASA